MWVLKDTAISEVGGLETVKDWWLLSWFLCNPCRFQLSCFLHFKSIFPHLFVSQWTLGPSHWHRHYLYADLFISFQVVQLLWLNPEWYSYEQPEFCGNTNVALRKEEQNDLDNLQNTKPGTVPIIKRFFINFKFTLPYSPSWCWGWNSANNFSLVS